MKIIQGAVAFGTMYLAYTAYRQMQENNAKTHTTDLKGLVNQWLARLPDVQKSESTEPSHDNFGFSEWSHPSLLFSIENHTLFNDIFHHIPNIKKSWNNFKILIIDYDKKRKILFEKIDGYIKQKLKGFYFGDPNFGLGLKGGFPLSIYMEAVCLAKGDNSGYQYDYTIIGRTNVVMVPPPVERVQLNYSLSGSSYILAEIDQKIIDEVKNIHKEIIKECKNQYISEIKEIIEIENKIRDSREDLI